MNLGSRLPEVPVRVSGYRVSGNSFPLPGFRQQFPVGPQRLRGSLPRPGRAVRSAVTCALRAAGVLGARGILAEQWRAHLCLAQHPPAMAGALRTGVDVPRFSFHKVLSSRGVANGGGAELWLLHHKVIWEMTENENTRNYSIAVSPTPEAPGAVCSKGQRRSGCRRAPSTLIKTTVRK